MIPVDFGVLGRSRGNGGKIIYHLKPVILSHAFHHLKFRKTPGIIPLGT
jgi:hypothetical protein